MKFRTWLEFVFNPARLERLIEDEDRYFRLSLLHNSLRKQAEQALELERERNR